MQFPVELNQHLTNKCDFLTKVHLFRIVRCADMHARSMTGWVSTIVFLGISVRWDKAMRAYVILQPQYMGRVCGLCGNFDKQGDNDFRASTGEIETTALAFANSW